MNRLIVRAPLSKEIAQVANMLMDMEGICTCGQILRRLDPKFILCNLITGYASLESDKNTIIIAAYCLPCSITINDALKSIRKIIHGPGSETAPVDHKPKYAR